MSSVHHAASPNASSTNSSTPPPLPRPDDPRLYTFFRSILEASDLIDRRRAEREQATSEQEGK